MLQIESADLFGKPEDEKIAEPSSTPSSLEEFSPTVSGKTALTLC